MKDESATVEAEPDDAEARAEARTARQLAMLQELAEIGLQIEPSRQTSGGGASGWPGQARP